jgi:hypothetical protein
MMSSSGIADGWHGEMIGKGGGLNQWADVTDGIAEILER